MSTSENTRSEGTAPEKTQFNLTVSVEGPACEFAFILLYNGYNEAVAKAYGSLSKLLNKGIYRVVIEMNENKVERMVILDKDTTETISWRSSASSIAAKNFNTSHEYYSMPAEEWSKKSTIASPGGAQDGSLFIFFRATNATVAKDIKVSPGKNFFVLDASRKISFRLEGEDVKEDREHGWASFHAALEPGQYYLHYAGSEPREIPVYVFKDWQTQLFITVAEKPIFASLKILIADKAAGFNPEDEFVHKMDAMLQKLFNGIYYLPSDVLTMLAYSKWDNPMAGILGAHMYLNSDKKDQDSLFQLVLDNLENRILKEKNCPDLIALKMLASLHFGKHYEGPALKEPCMFLSGMNAAIKVAASSITAIEPKSAAEAIIIDMYRDIPWTSYKPKKLPAKSEARNIDIAPGGSVEFDAPAMETPSFRRPRSAAKKASTPKIPANLNSWVTSSVLNYLQANQGKIDMASIQDIALQLQVTPSIVASTINNLKKFIDTSLSSLPETKAIPASPNLKNMSSMSFKDLLRNFVSDSRIHNQINKIFNSLQQNKDL